VKISYFIHDVGHPDLLRRYEMLRVGGAATSIFGFRRARNPDAEIAGAIVDLGRTFDARFAQRIWAVASAIPSLRRYATRLASSDVILARNLEMLLLAMIARQRYAPAAALVYECLDIHRVMLSSTVAGQALRALERALLRRCEGLMVSSPAFIREYFQRVHPTLPKTFVVENKVFAADTQSGGELEAPPSGPPWRIGWFGMLRCRRSLDVLLHLLRSAPQAIEVVVAGLPAPGVFGDAQATFGGIPGLSFLGPFKDEIELSRLFRSVHFAWTMDFYEAGGNSDLLLPNRLYRAALYGAVPIASASVETGRWLAARAAGFIVNEPIEDNLVALITSMTQESFANAKAALEKISRTELVTGPGECRDLVRALAELRGLRSASSGPARSRGLVAVEQNGWRDHPVGSGTSTPGKADAN